MSEWRPSSKPTGALLRLFVKIDVTNLHARTLTSRAVLVNRIPRARWLFSQMALLDLRTSPPSGIGRHAGGWDVGCHTPEGFGGRRVRRSEIVRPTWPMRPRCLLADRRSARDVATACPQRTASGSPTCALVARTDAAHSRARGSRHAPAHGGCVVNMLLTAHGRGVWGNGAERPRLVQTQCWCPRDVGW
eukprot:scaffold33466_cov37-Phaeocystis_antarctica.AAC.1